MEHTEFGKILMDFIESYTLPPVTECVVFFLSCVIVFYDI